MLKRHSSLEVSIGTNQPETMVSSNCANTESPRPGPSSPIPSVTTVNSFTGLNCELESCLVSLGTFADTTTSTSDASSSSFSSISSVPATRMLLEDGGNLPLHVAVSSFAMEVMADPDQKPVLEQRIRDLALANPASVNAFNHAGMTPFHLACKEGASYQIIFDLLSIWPHAVSTPTRPVRRRKGAKHPMLPLHIACRYYAGLAEAQHKVIAFLLRVHPEAAKLSTSEIEEATTIPENTGTNNEITSTNGDLPLHLYCENHFCNLSVLDLILKAYPPAIQQRNRHGQLPLHSACERRYFQRLEKSKHTKSATQNPSTRPTAGSGGDIIRYLIKEYPDALLICDDKKGELPLHAAVRGYQDAATVKYMLKSCAQSIQFVDLSGRTALHRCVMRTNIDPDVMAILLEFDPYATCIIDHHEQGNIPLQYAGASKSLDVIYTLIRSCPMSLEILRNSPHMREIV